MREIDRKYSIQRKKLVKTTTFVTLLVAAALILSGAVTGITMNMKEKITTTETEPLGAELIADVRSEFDVDQAGPSDYSMEVDIKSLERMAIAWDNDVTQYDNIYRSDTSSSYRTADDFILGVDTVIGGVNWLGGNWGGGPNDEADVQIKFYQDSGNQPGAVHAGPFFYTWASIYKQGPYSPWTVWYNEVSIPPVMFDAGQKYWVEVAYEGPGYPYWGFAVHPGIQLTNAKQWTGSSWINTGEDAAFQLTYVPYDHDVGVTEIKHPTHGDLPGCPCIPVEVELTNFGTEDALDVDVNVEIHRNLMCTSFPQDDYNMPWILNPAVPPGNWQFVQQETWFPYKVEPAHGDWMAEFNQHGMTGGIAEMITEEPINLCGECIDPWLKFYFWHDDYGSDDYMDVWVSTSGPGGGWIKIGGPYERLCCPECPVGWKEYRISLEQFICNDIWIKFVGHGDGTPSAYNLFVDWVCVFDLEYEATETLDIDAGSTEQVEFECWDATCWWCQDENEYVLFWVGAWSEYDLDENPDNDGYGPFEWMYKPVWIYIPWTHDVGDKEILEPADDYYMAGPIPMKQLIKNYGKEPEGCFNVYMAVRELDVVTKLYETFDCWERDPDHYPTYYYAYRPCGWTEVGGYYSDYGWEQWFSNNAGGASGPTEACLYYGYARYYSDNIMTSPSVNTLGEDKLELEFDTFIDWYYGSNYCWMYVECTPDGGMSGWTDYTPWANPISGNVGPAHFVVNIDAMMGPDTQVRFRFYGYYFYFDYWYVDDVKLVSYTCGDKIYQEKICVDDIQVCQEIELDFPDFIPEPPEPCYCGTVDYCIDSWTKMLDPPDQNPANDLKRKFITVEFMHDVGIKEFTSPETEIGAEEIIKYHDGYDSNAVGLTAPGTWCGGMRLTPTELTPHNGKDIIAVNVYYHESASIDGAVIIYEGDTPTTPGAVLSTEPFTFSGAGLKRVDLSTTVEVEDYEDIWVCVQWEQLTVPFYPFGVDPGPATPGKGDWVSLDCISWAELAGYGLSYDWVIEAVVEAGNGGDDELPEPDVYVPCEEVDICAMFENLGTYTEQPTITWAFYEYQPAKTELDSGSFQITMAPMTQSEECLLTFDFTGGEGVYEIEVEIQLTPPSMDCDLSNNGPINLVIGADCCGPESCFVLDPEYPDGLNNWYVSPVEVTVDAWEVCAVQSGISHIVYIVDGVMDTIAGAHGVFVIDGDGVHHGEIYAVDNVGNEGTHHTFEVAIDTGDPTVELVFNKYEDAGVNYVEFTALAGDATSGMDRVEFTIDGVLEHTVPGTGPYVFTVDWSGYDGSTQVCAKAYDDAGNSAEACVSGVEFSKPHSQSQSQTQSQSQPVVKRVTVNLGR
jgi:hypothetical protein